MKPVSDFHVDVLKHWSATRNIDGKTELARPVGYHSILHNIRCAWKVLTGKADIVRWTEEG